MRSIGKRLVLSFVMSLTSTLHAASIFDRFVPPNITGDLADYVSVTDVAIVTEAKHTELKYRVATAAAELKAATELEGIYKRLLAHRAVSDEKYETVRLRYDLSLIEMDRAKVILDEFATLKSILNLRENWELHGVPNDGVVLQAKYLTLWDQRCTARTLEYTKADKTYEFSKKQYDRGRSLSANNTISREEIIELEFKLKAAENELKARYDLTTECAKK